WGMGATVSSYSTAKRLEVGSPGGGQGGRNKKGQDTEQELRRALADRIEDSLGNLLQRVETLLREDRAKVLCLAHALETHTTPGRTAARAWRAAPGRTAARARAGSGHPAVTGRPAPGLRPAPDGQDARHPPGPAGGEPGQRVHPGRGPGGRRGRSQADPRR